MTSTLNSSVVSAMTAEGERLFQCGIVLEKTNSSGNHIIRLVSAVFGTL